MRGYWSALRQLRKPLLGAAQRDHDTVTGSAVRRGRHFHSSLSYLKQLPIDVLKLYNCSSTASTVRRRISPGAGDRYTANGTRFTGWSSTSRGRIEARRDLLGSTGAAAGAAGGALMRAYRPVGRTA